MSDSLDQLERLARLREQGVLTDEDFLAQKARLLSDATVCPGCGAPTSLDQFGRCAYCGHVSLSVMSAPGAAPAPGPRGASPDPQADEAFRASRGNMIAAIKQLRAETGLDLKDAKARIEAARSRVQL
jgi:hypothetical protein